MTTIKQESELHQRKRRNIFRQIFDYVLDVVIDAVIIVSIVVVIRNFIISPFQVSWNSMVDTLHNNDYIFIEKLTYRFRDPKFWDIIIFEPPVPRIRELNGIQCFISHLNHFTLSSNVCESPDLYIKRVIWLPWDEIKFNAWVVYRNWAKLDETNYLNMENNWHTDLPFWQQQQVFVVPKNSVFALWDNRNWSSDSRYWKDTMWQNKPFVSYDKIEWKYFFRLFSPNKLFN